MPRPLLRLLREVASDRERETRSDSCEVHIGYGGVELANGFCAVGGYLYVADLSSTRLCLRAPGHAVLFGWFQRTQVGPKQPLEYDLCPRTLLARQIS